MGSSDMIINKLILLFLLDKMEMPLSENSILNICWSKNDWINYMECKEALFQLLEVNFVYNIHEEAVEMLGGGEARYNITYEGRKCLSHFYRRIPTSLRDEMIEYTTKNRLDLKRSQEYVHTYEKDDDGSYTLYLKILSSVASKPLFELKLKAPSRASAIKACQLWEEKAPSVYESVYDSLIIDEE